MTTENESADEMPPTQRVYEVMDDDELSLEEKQRRVLAIGREYLGVTNGHIQRHLSDSATDEILVSVSEDSELLPEGTTLDRSKTYCRHTVQEPSPVAISNAPEQGWQDDPAYEEHDIDGYLGTTMFVRGDVYGTVCFIQRTPRDDGFTTEEKMFIELVARLLGREIEATQLDQRTEEKEALQAELEKTTRGTLQLASELEERYQQLFETAVEGIYTTTDTLDEYAMANPAFAELLGYESGEELCAAVDSIEDEVFVDPDAYATYSETLTSVGELDKFEYRVRTADGEIRWVSDSVTALTDDEGRIEGYRGGVVDITDQKKREQNLVRQQQLNTVLLRVFRHNIRNEFTVIRGYTDMMVDQLEDDSIDGSAVISAIDRVLALAEKSTELDAFLIEDIEVQPFDMMTLIREVNADIEGEYPEASIEVTGPDEVPISGYQNLKAALHELIENACKHPEAPTVTVSAEVDHETIELEVSDNGPGLPEQEYRVLETGTEEPLVHGKGLGLWMVYWVVTGHGGDIETTVSDEGTTITITLPQSTAGPESDGTNEIVPVRQQSGDLFQRIFEETADTLVIVDDDGQTLRVNESATNLIGLPKQDILGRSFDEFTVDSFDFRELSRDDRDSGLQRETATLVRPDGSERIVECSVTNDIVPGMHLIVCRNITERKEREEELQETKQRLDLALQGTNTGVWEWEIGSDEVVWNESMERLFGLEPGTFEGTYDAFKNRIHPDDIQDFEEAIESSVKTHESFQLESRIQRPDSEQRWVDARAEVHTDDDGPERMIGVITDVTDRKEQEKEIRELNDQLEVILNTAEAAIFLKDRDGRYLQMNQRCRDELGLGDDEDIVGLTDDDVFPEDIAAQYRADDARVFEENEPIETEEEVPTADGTRTHLTRKTPITDEDGNTYALCGISTNITGRKERERELEVAETVFQNTQDALVLVDVVDEQEYRLNRVNEAFEALTPYTTPNITGTTPREMLGDEVGGELRSQFRECVTTQKPVKFEQVAPGDEGSRIWKVQLTPLIQDGEVTQLVLAMRNITDRKEREQELRQAERRLSVALDAADAGVWEWDIESEEIVWDETMERILGLEPGAFEGTFDAFFDRIHPDDTAKLEANIEAAIEEGETAQWEIRIEHEDGGFRWIDTRVQVVTDQDGTATRIIGAGIDSTDRKEQEQELERAEMVFQNTQDALFLIDVSADKEFRIRRVNEGYEDATGLTSAEVTGKTPREVVGEEVGADIESRYRECVERQETIQYVEEVPVDGGLRFWETKLSPIIEDGSVTQLVGATRDITERRERERELSRVKERYETLLGAAPDPVFVADGETGEIIEANDAAETLLGMSSDEIIGSHQSELHPSDQADLYQQLFEEHVQTGGTRRRLPDGSPIYIVTDNGDHVPVEISVETVSLPDGPVTYGIFRDISERVKREEELAEKTRQLEAIVQNTSEAIYIKDTVGHYQFINESGAELFGHTPEEIIGKHDEDLFDPESAADIRADDVQVMESGEEMSEETVRFIDGEEHVFLDNKYPYRDEDGEIIGMIGISPDITERKQYVREIERRNERVDFASVVSHDLQNPLNVAQGQLQQAQKECESEHLDAIEHAHERMETLITDLRTLSQTGQAIGDLEAVTLEALSDECWQNVETTDSEMHTTTDGVIQADRSRLKQLLENLFRNAVEHGGENVTVTIGDLDSDRGFYVEDDGSGVPDGDRDQLFEPGYTTAQSTGLGLPIVKQIADAHGWAVTVSSGSAGGARFEFTGVVFTDEPHPSSGTADDTQDADAEESNE